MKAASSSRLLAGLRLGLFGSLLALLPTTVPLSGGESDKPTSPPPDQKKDPLAAGPGDMEAHFTDGSKLRLTLQDNRITLLTPYGKLVIPVADIHRVELATRVPPEVARRIERAVADLESSEFATREAASATLLSLGARAYPALLKAAESTDLEVRKRAEHILEKIRDRIPEEQLVVRKKDVVHTADSKFTGQIDSDSLKAVTSQFGEVQLKLSDTRFLRSRAIPFEDDGGGPVAADPGNLEGRGPVGKTFRFRVTGVVTGFIWGTDVYTTDSALATVAVHAGVLKAGETAVVKVTMVAPPAAFTGSTRNGVTSSPYMAYPSAYKVSRVKTE
jgi:hypothetical protein